MSASASPGRTIPEALAFWAGQTPRASAVLSPGREPITYGELQPAVERLAATLRACGVGRQDRVALLFPEGPELCLVLLAAISAGVAVPLAWPSPAPELQQSLAQSRVRAVVVSAALPKSAVVPALSGAGLELPLLTLFPAASGKMGDFRLDGPRVGAPAPAYLSRGDDVALILRSSGTTGRPKLVPRTHRHIVSTAEVFIEARAIAPTDRCLSLARLVYSQGFNTFMSTIRAGACFVSVPGPNVRTLPGWLTTYRPTYMATTPTVLRAMVTEGDDMRAALLASPLRCVSATSEPLLPETQFRLEAFIGVPILNGYGLSEATGIAGEWISGDRRVAGAVGLPWCEVRVIGENAQPVGPNEPGEIVVRGDRVIPGYLDDMEANAASFLPGGWFRTGDFGLLDDGEWLHLIGRLGEFINRGGEKIAPAEVDDALLAHPAVADAAAFAVPDDMLGEDVVAAVVMKPGMTVAARDLRHWLLGRLSPYKVPRRIWVVDAMPRTPTGKPLRAELARQWVEARR